jgi:hypothetical protein
MGLMPFRIPFEDFRYQRPSWRRQNLWLRHGLAPSETPEVMLAALGAAISIDRMTGGIKNGEVVEGVPFSFKLVNNATAQIEAPFEPKQWYKITVAASTSIRDGFGQPLETSTAQFQMEDAPPMWLQPQEFGLFQDFVGPDGGGQWSIISRGKHEVSSVEVYHPASTFARAIRHDHRRHQRLRVATRPCIQI